MTSTATAALQVSFDHHCGDADNEKGKALDDVDFTSGYETQYAKEYRLVRQTEVSPPDPKLIWYRDWKTIMMVGVLMSVLLAGSVVLIRLVFTDNPWNIFIITIMFIAAALVAIYIEVKSVHAR